MQFYSVLVTTLLVKTALRRLDLGHKPQTKNLVTNTERGSVFQSVVDFSASYWNLQYSTSVIRVTCHLQYRRANSKTISSHESIDKLLVKYNLENIH